MMEADCKALIDKYVRSDSVIACLELTGYTSALLIRNLDSNQIDQIEEFVRHACTVMNPNQARSFLGSVFSSHAEKFCFPIGVRMGLMLAVNELKSLNGNISGNIPHSSEKSVQTDISIGCSFSSFLNPNLHFLNKLTSNSIFCDQPQLRLSNDLNSLPSTPKSNIDQVSDGFIDTTEMVNHNKPHTSFEVPLKQSNNNNSSSNNHLTETRDEIQHRNTLMNEINVEHLKQHSSASAIRLASRQFINANLVQNRHFKIDMEVNPTSEGGPLRVTGIFNCHLCRQKRDRSTPVRFSIARNRYPVMSNVLSHLKIHFQPLLLSPTSHDSNEPGNNSVESQNPRLIKQENLVYSQSDSSVGVDSLSPFNLDHLMMAGGGTVVNGPPVGLGGVHHIDMKMFPAVQDK